MVTHAIAIIVCALAVTGFVAEGLSTWFGIPVLAWRAGWISALIGWEMFDHRSLWLYRPQENHLGVIYRLGRFHRFADPNEWTLLFPIADRVSHEISLYMRTAELELQNVELRDGLTVKVKFKVFFTTDLRQAAPERLLQALKFRRDEWSEVVKTGTEDLVRNQVFLTLSYTDLAAQRVSREVKKRLSRELISRVRGFGIQLNEEYGVMPLDVQPNRVYRDAVLESKAATPVGEAALERLRPFLEVLEHVHPDTAHAAMLLHIASKISQTGQLPEIVLSPSSEFPVNPIYPSVLGGDGRGGGNGNGNGNGHRPHRAGSADKAHS
jgi:hypothetical protein